MTTNAVYDKIGSPIVFKASGGNVTFTPKNIANGAGRISARADLGAFPRPTRYRWYAENQCQATTPVVGYLIRYYLVFWDDDTTPGRGWGDTGTTDAAFNTENDLRNIRYIGSLVVDTAAADVIFSGGGEDIYIPYRYVSVVVWNASGASLTNDDTEHQFILTPVYTDVQAAA